VLALEKTNGKTLKRYLHKAKESPEIVSIYIKGDTKTNAKATTTRQL